MSSPSKEATDLVRRFVTEVQQNGDLSLIDELVHPDFFDHETPPGLDPGRAAVSLIMNMLHKAMKDIKIEIIHCVSDGEVVATHKILRGVQVEELFGKPATGEMIATSVMDFIRVKDGKLIEHWANRGPVLDA